MGEGLMKTHGLSGIFGLPDIDLFGVPITDVVVDGATLAGSAILVTQINNRLAPMVGVAGDGYLRDLTDILVGVAAGAAIASFMGQHKLAEAVAKGPAMLALIRIIGRVTGQVGLAGSLGLVSVEPLAGRRSLGLLSTEERLDEVSLSATPAYIPGFARQGYSF